MRLIITGIFPPDIGGSATYVSQIGIQQAFPALNGRLCRVKSWHGFGKTFIAVHLLKRIADAGILRRALFVCDWDALHSQGLGAFQNVFGAEAAEVYKNADGSNHAHNARIHIATYQTFTVASDDATTNFLTTFYPEHYFNHIIIDECHHSAWGKWSQALTQSRRCTDRADCDPTPPRIYRADQRGHGRRINYRWQSALLRRTSI